jgi:hypothetical protein
MIGRVSNCYERGHDRPPSSGDIQIVSVRPDSLATFLAILLAQRIRVEGQIRVLRGLCRARLCDPDCPVLSFSATRDS